MQALKKLMGQLLKPRPGTVLKRGDIVYTPTPKHQRHVSESSVVEALRKDKDTPRS